MCGRYVLHADPALLARAFGVAEWPDYETSWNVAPTDLIPAVTIEEGTRRAALYRWGLVPFWAKEIGSYSTINARAETAASKPAFRVPFRRRRCLIPAEGYYEWQQRAGGKQPWYIHGVNDELLAFAGLWDRWRRPDGDTLRSAAIVVTDANADTKPIHDRMPVILARKDWERWLDPDNHDTTALAALMRPVPCGQLLAYPVSRRVNSPKNDGPELLEPEKEEGEKRDR